MTVAVVTEGAVICVLLLLLYLLMRSAARERSERADAYERTLQTLADRVQAPDRLPVAPAPNFLTPEQEPDDWNKVGSIDYEVKEPHGGTD